MLAMLLVLGFTAGFETKMCNHEETVENIKKTYKCAVDFGKNFIKKGKELASGGINNISVVIIILLCHKHCSGTVMQEAIKEGTQKCMVVVLGCVPVDQIKTLFSSPAEVVATDNNCKAEQVMAMAGKVKTCAMDYGFDDSEGEPKFTKELCEKMGTGVKKCVLDMKIDCFSERENSVMAEIMGTALGDAKEIYAMDEVQKMVAKNMTDNQRDLVKCVLESGSTTGTSSFITVTFVLFCILLIFYF